MNTNGELCSTETLGSGVSWGAIFAGAAAAAALSLILLILGFGLGLSALSPWSYNAAAIGVSTIAWIAFMQLMASGVGGYLAGRLRVKWANVHTDEVYFRDTAHGLLSWSVASLMSATLLAGTVGTVLGGAIDLGAKVTGIAASTVAATASSNQNNNASASQINPLDYFTDMLLRSDQPETASDNAAVRPEMMRVIATNITTGELDPQDRDYLARMVAQHTGMTQLDAQNRVDDVYTRLSKTVADAKVAADNARKAAAHSALWMFVALLFGAFVASFMATFGGRLRDKAHMPS